MLPAVMMGLLMGFLLTCISAPRKAPAGFIAASDGARAGHAAIAADYCSSGEIDSQFREGENRSQGRLTSRQAALRGMRNVSGLLGITKTLAIEAMRNTALHYGVPEVSIEAAGRRIASANRPVLDGRLGDSAMVDDRLPSEIRFGPTCARELICDDDAVFTLAHELIHIGNSGGDLGSLARHISRDARSIACVRATESQEEDLACDFIAEIVLRNFVAMRPTAKSPEERLWLTLAGGGTGDRAHLSDVLTIRALIGLDPQLRFTFIRWLWDGGPGDYADAESQVTE